MSRAWLDFTISLWIVTMYNILNVTIHNVRYVTMSTLGFASIRSVWQYAMHTLDISMKICIALFINNCKVAMLNVFPDANVLKCHQCCFYVRKFFAWDGVRPHWERLYALKNIWKNGRLVLIFFLSNNLLDRLSIGGVGVNIFWKILLCHLDMPYHYMFRLIRRPFQVDKNQIHWCQLKRML